MRVAARQRGRKEPTQASQRRVKANPLTLSALKHTQPLALQHLKSLDIAPSLNNRLHSGLRQLPPLLRRLLLAPRLRLRAPAGRHAGENLPAVVGREVDEPHVQTRRGGVAGRPAAGMRALTRLAARLHGRAAQRLPAGPAAVEARLRGGAGAARQRARADGDHVFWMRGVCRVGGGRGVHGLGVVLGLHLRLRVVLAHVAEGGHVAGDAEPGHGGGDALR